MATTEFDPLAIRKRLGRADWSPPKEFGPTGWCYDGLREPLRILVSEGPAPDDQSGVWLHASISHRDRIPTYDELVLLHHAVWGASGWAYQVFAPAVDHINIHPNVLHLWGRTDGRAELPNFGLLGSI